MTTQTTRTKPIVISAKSDSGRDVLVVTEEQDRFLLAVPEAITACRMYQELQAKRHEFFDDLLGRLQEWLVLHRDNALTAYLTFREAGLFFVVKCRDAFDETLEKDLTKLDIEIARAFPQFRLDVLEVPDIDDDQLAAFVSARIPPIQFKLSEGE